MELARVLVHPQGPDVTGLRTGDQIVGPHVGVVAGMPRRFALCNACAHGAGIGARAGAGARAGVGARSIFAAGFVLPGVSGRGVACRAIDVLRAGSRDLTKAAQVRLLPAPNSAGRTGGVVVHEDTSLILLGVRSAHVARVRGGDGRACGGGRGGRGAVWVRGDLNLRQAGHAVLAYGMQVLGQHDVLPPPHCNPQLGERPWLILPI
mmetsp:Transcript_112133/g.194694  ORF Transcript_112133/g.194694 Transcript_112133/m.194694 type:complete len:207 (-) Transcript_112133:303-923(-)